MSTVIERRASAKPILSCGPGSLRVGQERDRAPEPDWQAMLDQIAPPAVSVSSLKILWEAGDPWRPVERWVIWQVYPEGVTPILLADAIKGPHPRSTGHACFAGYCGCDVKANAWVGGPSQTDGLDRMQWELYQQTRRFHKRYWVVQGYHGGHRRRYTDVESMVSEMHGGPDQPPAPGDLPYATPDMRTWRAIGAMDLMRRYSRLITDFTRRTIAQFDREDRDAAQAAQWEMWKWLDRQIAGPAEVLAHRLKYADESVVPRLAPWQQPRELKDDVVLEQFINEGASQPLTTVAA